MGILNMTVVPKIKAVWDDVAYALRYEIYTVDSIRSKYNSDPTKCCKELFRDWLTTNNGAGPKTWFTLLEKLKNVVDFAAAREVIMKELTEMYTL